MQKCVHKKFRHTGTGLTLENEHEYAWENNISYKMLNIVKTNRFASIHINRQI